ncbi:MAG: YggS family pyridoxal phosphate-dependent enzyme [Planctomycetota bacterium]
MIERRPTSTPAEGADRSRAGPADEHPDDSAASEVGQPLGAELDARYRDVMHRVAGAARRSGREPSDVLVVAVTKYAHPDQVRKLLEAGHSDFAENRVQQLTDRVAMVEQFLERHRILTPSHKVTLPERVRRHMIGHLQRNKVKKVFDLVTLIHSVDTLRLAEEIQDVGMRKDRTIDVLLQINCSQEKSKYGVALPAARHLAELIDTMVFLRLRGVMTMAPYTDDQTVVRGTFERCRDVYEDIRKAGIGGSNFNILSMGMSNDFETAIECGANMVRVGSAIFGERTTAAEEPDE